MIRKILEGIRRVQELDLRPARGFKPKGEPKKWDWKALKAEYEKYIGEATKVYEKIKDTPAGAELMAKDNLFHGVGDDGGYHDESKRDPRPMMKWIQANIDKNAFKGDYFEKPPEPVPEGYVALASDTDGDFIHQADGVFDTPEEAQQAGWDLAEGYLSDNIDYFMDMYLSDDPNMTDEEVWEEAKGQMAVYVKYQHSDGTLEDWD